MMRLLRRYVLHNFWLKVISLAAAVLLWGFVVRDPVAEVAVTVPIEFHHVPENLEISSEAIPQAQVRVRGPSRQVRELSAADVHAVIGLDGALPGERTFDLSGPHIRVPRGVEVVQVVPNHVRLNFDRRVTRELSVQPRVIGTFASGFHLASTAVEPAKVTVVGPQNRVSELETAVTDPVDATGVVGHAVFTTHVYAPDPLVRVVKPSTVRVTVVTQKAEKKTSSTGPK